MKSHRAEKRKAQAQLLQLRMWADQGNVACRHMCLLLGAELLSISSDSDTDEVLTVYTKAGEAACHVSMIHHEALAHELAARFVLSKGDRHMSQKCFSRAIDLYDAWGAAGKVQQIRSEFRNVLLLKREALESTMEFTLSG
jgi:hypothetical protein